MLASREPASLYTGTTMSTTGAAVADASSGTLRIGVSCMDPGSGPGLSPGWETGKNRRRRAQGLLVELLPCSQRALTDTPETVGVHQQLGDTPCPTNPPSGRRPGRRFGTRTAHTRPV